jgi:hypothetical protein
MLPYTLSMTTSARRNLAQTPPATSGAFRDVSRSLPVKLSSQLVDSAREVSQLADRSITAQVEHWARLGRAAERLLTHDQVMALKRDTHEAASQAPEEITRIKQVLASMLIPQFPGATSKQLREGAAALGAPLYESDPADPALLRQVWPVPTRLIAIHGKTVRPYLDPA